MLYDVLIERIAKNEDRKLRYRMILRLADYVYLQHDQFYIYY